MSAPGFIPEAGTEEAAAHERARRNWLAEERACIKQSSSPCRLTISEAGRATPAPSATSPDQAGLPSFHAYLVAVPAGWKALRPVLYPAPAAPDEPAQQGIPAALLKGFHRYKLGVLLCHPETDGQEATREFLIDTSLEAALLGPDGQYLQVSPTRPLYAVLPLAAPNPSRKDADQTGDCLVLVPLIDSPIVEGKQYPSPRLIVDGVQVFPSMQKGAS